MLMNSLQASTPMDGLPTHFQMPTRSWPICRPTSGKEMSLRSCLTAVSAGSTKSCSTLLSSKLLLNVFVTRSHPFYHRFGIFTFHLCQECFGLGLSLSGIDSEKICDQELLVVLTPGEVVSDCCHIGALIIDENLP